MEGAKTGLQALKEDPDEHNPKENSNVQNEITLTSKFDSLIELVQTSFAEVQSSTQDLMELKDELLMQFLPPTLKFKMAVIFGNMYRSLSDLNTPVSEMLRLIKIYSAPWEKNSALLKKLNDMYETKKQLLNIAIKRLTLVDKSTELFQKERRIMNWEKLYLKLSEAKGHGRRWKFHIETFRKKSNQGYNELLSWVMRDSREQASEKEENRRKLDRKGNSKPNHHRRKEREHDPNMINQIKEDEFEAKSKSSFTTKQTDENVIKKLADDSYMVDVDSDQDIFSDSSERESRRSRKKSEKPPVETAEISAQTEPDVENVACWTGEPNYTRYFIVRLFKPHELSTKKLKFKISYGTTSFISKNFETVKLEKKVKINEQQIKPRKFKSKNNDENDYDEKKIDTSKYEDFIFELSDFISKKSDLSTTISNDDCIQFEMKSEDKEAKDTVSAFLNLPIDDVHTLDLPILYYKDTEEAQVVDFYETTPVVKKSKADPSAAWLRLNDMTTEAAENYELLSKRLPYTFDMYKNKTIKTGHAVCKLPVMFFWVRKPWIFKFDKNTGTQTIKDIVEEFNRENPKLMPEPSLMTQNSIITKSELESKLPEPIIEIRTVEIVKTIEKPAPDAAPKDLTDRGCSPIPITMQPVRPPSTPVRSLKQFDMSEIKPDLTSEEIQNMQETYRLKIDELNLTIYKLENELSQLRSINDYRSDPRLGKMAPKNRMNINKNDKLMSKTPDNDLSYGKKSVHPNTSVDMKALPKDFFERLKAFNEKSSNHHRDLMTKYMEEEANIIEQQMAVQHRLDNQATTQTGGKFEDFCLPAVFMPFKSSNSVFNPRAHQYFHPSGSNEIRLTQPPAIFQLPPIPPKSSISVINLFDLGRRYQAGEPDYYINEYIKREYSNKTSNQKNSEFTQEEESDYASNKTYPNESNLKTNLN